jgi:hypothetical protein
LTETWRIDPVVAAERAACSPGASRDCPALVLAERSARALAHQLESAKSTLMEVEAAAVPKVSSPRAHGAHPLRKLR